MKQSRVLLLCYLFFVFSCSKEPISQINQETSLAQPHEVTEEIAQKVALSFIKENYYHETKSNNRVIKEHFTLNNQKGSDLLHVFNYENGGFTVIAGDNRLPPVLAYSDDTYFENSSIDFPLGLRIWINNIISTVEYFESHVTEQDERTISLWNKYLGELATRSQTPEGGMKPETDTLIGPLLTNTWHQYEPYNECLSAVYHNNINTNQQELHVPVIGCVPLSIARVMHFWQFPCNISWSSMSLNSANTFNKDFLANVHTAVKSFNNSSMSFYYNPDGTTATDSLSTSVSYLFSLGNFLIQTYGYSSATTISYSSNQYNTIIREMVDYERPVILQGFINTNHSGGHAWVCDGYHYKFEHWYDSEMNPIGVETKKFHHCWGLPNSQYDGWYNLTNMDHDGDGFSFINDMILTYRIYP